MPLILLTGYPSSGKSTRAREIAEEFRTRCPDRNVVLVSDSEFGIEKSVYRDAKSEKTARATLMSALKRHLSRETIVIVDGLNYIKGYRYQIFCEAKAEQTTYAVVHVGTPTEICKSWNLKRQGEDRTIWDDDLIDALIFRYEEPNGMNRWDSPLYTIVYTDNISVLFPGLYDSIIHAKPKPPNFATILKPAASSDYVYQLDRQAQEIVKLVTEAQNDGRTGLEMKFGGSGVKLILPMETVSSAQLQRLKRNFVSLHKVRQMDIARIRDAFVEFLNRNFQANE
ncbi:chromatin associated protein KTI12 [Limtongia smithiae]|uniref:chromatin associated protein KTI12 n=1 Tax=Limtongia smithiae TaxID=1125753 RepID=UPI0034CF5B30